MTQIVCFSAAILFSSPACSAIWGLNTAPQQVFDVELIGWAGRVEARRGPYAFYREALNVAEEWQDSLLDSDTRLVRVGFLGEFTRRADLVLDCAVLRANVMMEKTAHLTGANRRHLHPGNFVGRYRHEIQSAFDRATVLRETIKAKPSGTPNQILESRLQTALDEMELRGLLAAESGYLLAVMAYLQSPNADKHFQCEGPADEATLVRLEYYADVLTEMLTPRPGGEHVELSAVLQAFASDLSSFQSDGIQALCAELSKLRFSRLLRMLEENRQRRLALVDGRSIAPPNTQVELRQDWVKNLAPKLTLESHAGERFDAPNAVVVALTGPYVYSVRIAPQTLSVHSRDGELLFQECRMKDIATAVSPFGDGVNILRYNESDNLQYVRESSYNFITSVSNVDIRGRPLKAVSAGSTTWFLSHPNLVDVHHRGRQYRSNLKLLNDGNFSALAVIHERMALVATDKGEVISISLDDNFEIVKRDWSVHSLGPEIVALHRANFFSPVFLLDSNGQVSSLNLDSGARNSIHQLALSGEISCINQRQYLRTVSIGTTDGDVCIATWATPEINAMQQLGCPVLSVSHSDNALVAADEGGIVSFFSIGIAANHSSLSK